MNSTAKRILRDTLSLSKEGKEESYRFAKEKIKNVDDGICYSDLYNKDCVTAMRVYIFMWEREYITK